METQTPLIDESELTPSDQISLYKELIRLLEKEIDDATASNTKQGLTIWTLIAGIAGAAFVFFGQTKDLAAIPETTFQVFAVAVLAFEILVGTFNLVSGDGAFSKKGRLIDTKQALRGRLFAMVFRFLVLLVVSLAISTLSVPIWLKVVAIMLPLLPSLYFLLAFIALVKTDRPMGNNPSMPHIPRLWALLFLACYLGPAIALGSTLDFPVGPVFTTAYILGLSLAAMLVMFEILIAISTSTTRVREIRELKDDLVFRRVELNEGLIRFRIIQEGKSVYDQMRPGLEGLLKALEREDEVYHEQMRILDEVSRLSGEGNSQPSKEAHGQIEILLNSFGTYTRELNGLINFVNTEVPKFNDKLSKAAAASGDYSTSAAIQSNLSERLARLVKQEQQLNEKRQVLTTKLNSLSPNQNGE